MKTEHEDELIKLTNEMGDALEAINTYFKREKILIDKLSPFLPPWHLEEWGEFLIDWRKVLTRFGETSKKRDILLLKILGLDNDN